jgi:hypothetical protein
MFKLKINLDCHGPRPLPNICLLPNPHCFSFPPTFKLVLFRYDAHKWRNHNSLPLRFITLQIIKQTPTYTLLITGENSFYVNNGKFSVLRRNSWWSTHYPWIPPLKLYFIPGWSCLVCSRDRRTSCWGQDRGPVQGAASSSLFLIEYPNFHYKSCPLSLIVIWRNQALNSPSL